ncbi:3-hydroxyacyl-CoA dehydrogenase type-2-like protein [Dinothrombium tinctorium]|uniref:3-hydroxyacyl-CoA dehydrogenase type-2-like protein n=1 Tax=Dinothrombium tinctorium TaxID=1965070 RepID=A0A3S3PBN6_9ACAR|nr:3-hydroxyacyl-CoA dehydrogenase type-2-like protein [Dinothrombium tinctorium]RWS16281.1 3-hydroxyacyl-CoA dehydrogenase type-2-like protein [Dinothrombium tinctorium]
MCSLPGMVAFVTGAASGLGKATMLHLLNRGVKGVLAFDIQKFQFETPSNVVTVNGDISHEEHVNEALTKCKEHFGKLNAVINCAGVSVAFKLHNFGANKAHNLDDFRRVFEICALGTFNVNRLSAGLLAENEPEGGLKGIIINTSSVSAFDGTVGQVAHSAASGAINSMTLPMARDLSVEGIRVVTIAPGIFYTPLMDRMPAETLQYFAEMTPCPSRLGKPEEFAHLVASIIENPFINGSIIRLDGAIRLPA